ncbi:MAG: bile acid:sodium symporter family protein [Enterobacterales bacterium]|nr:bile acid:sodium symporter family protein [Enterobacterales bacterium]
MQADILTKLVLPLSLFFIMFGMGLSLKVMDFKRIFAFPKAVAVGIVGQMVLLPLVAFAIANLFKVPPELAVGLMIIALAPSGVTSNMYSYLFKGDVALSISLTALVGFLSPFTIPLVVLWSSHYFIQTGQSFDLPILKTIIQLLVITVVPVFFGMVFFKKWPNTAEKMERFFKWFSVIIMFVIIGLIMHKNWENMGQFFADVGVATITLNVSVLILGFYLAKWSKLDKKQSITIGFEVGLQNGTLAMVVAGSIIGNTTMMIPAVTYGLLMFITGGIYGWLVTRD